MDNINNLLYRIATADDEIAFRKLYYLYYDRLFKFVMHFIRNEMSCEEIISDVFFNIWQKRQQLPYINDLDAYLYKASKNKALHYIEKANREIEQEDLSFALEYIADDETPESRIIDDELSRILTEAVESLPEKCRMIFKLVREDELKYKQISEILSISVRTIDAQMAIAKTKIEAVIKKYYNNF
jgi:RNA polymerase sigma-70 factor (ECF subfamily)